MATYIVPVGMKRQTTCNHSDCSLWNNPRIAAAAASTSRLSDGTACPAECSSSTRLSSTHMSARALLSPGISVSSGLQRWTVGIPIQLHLPCVPTSSLSTLANSLSCSFVASNGVMPHRKMAERIMALAAAQPGLSLPVSRGSSSNDAAIELPSENPMIASNGPSSRT